MAALCLMTGTTVEQVSIKEQSTTFGIHDACLSVHRQAASYLQSRAGSQSELQFRSSRLEPQDLAVADFGCYRRAIVHAC